MGLSPWEIQKLKKHAHAGETAEILELASKLAYYAQLDDIVEVLELVSRESDEGAAMQQALVERLPDVLAQQYFPIMGRLWLGAFATWSMRSPSWADSVKSTLAEHPSELSAVLEHIDHEVRTAMREWRA